MTAQGASAILFQQLKPQPMRIQARVRLLALKRLSKPTFQLWPHELCKPFDLAWEFDEFNGDVFEGFVKNSMANLLNAGFMPNLRFRSRLQGSAALWASPSSQLRRTC